MAFGDNLTIPLYDKFDTLLGLERAAQHSVYRHWNFGQRLVRAKYDTSALQCAAGRRA